MVARTRLTIRRWVAALLFTIYTSNTWWSSLLLEEAGAVGDVLNKYAAATTLTVTNLHSLASSATWVAGWESPEIDNSTTGYSDFIITADLVAASSGLSNGEARMYVVAEIDSSYPDVFDGTESTETVTDVATRDAICKMIAMTVTDTTASQHWYLVCLSLKAMLGCVPRKFVVFITHSMGNNLASSGNSVTVRGVYENVAP